MDDYELEKLKSTLRIEDEEDVLEYEQEPENKEIFETFDKDEQKTEYSRISKSTVRTIGASSMRSSRTYVSQLERKLSVERKAREKLQQEVEELKRLSTTISSQMRLNSKQFSAKQRL